MILAEKLFQKLNNLKSKGELRDFFIYFDDNRELQIDLEKGKVSNLETPTSYVENSEGHFLIVWDEEYISLGDLSCACIGDFDEFFNLTKRIKVKHTTEVFIPEKGVYPMAVAYSKSLADMIDLPEYLLKIADVAQELNQMVKLEDSSTMIRAREGTRHIYSSRQLDESYSYTHFSLQNSLNDKFKWSIRLSEAFPIIKLEEVFRFFGDICNILNESQQEEINSKEKYNLILSPDIFREIFKHQVLDQFTAQTIQNGTSIFNLDKFRKKERYFGNLSLSYDPLVNYKPGTYRFTTFGLKAKKDYFIKYGKLHSPILNSLNYSYFGYDHPTLEISDFSNLKFEGIKKHTFRDIVKDSKMSVFGISPKKQKHKSHTLSELEFNDGIYLHEGKLRKSSKFGIKISILELLQNNQLELVEFVDGQFGCKISNIEIE